MAVALKGRGYRPALAIPTASPDELFRWYTGLEVPDPITFIVGEKWLNRPNIYPRQATLLKIIFLREDLFTQYDYDVVEEWEQNYKATGNNGIVPNLLWKMRWLKANGYKWFREVLLVMGRRAGKGHISGLAMSYVLWNYMAKGDPQGFYGVDRDKKLTCLVFAGKREQAKATVWRDIVNYVTGSTCFAPYISQTQAERLSVYAPHDMVRIRKQMEKGIFSELDMATFEIVPKESTMMAGRGPASFMQCLDPATPVLTSDLCWVPIGELQPGDHVVGVDEQPQSGQRKMRDAEVQAVWRTRKQAVRLTFADGGSVVCSTDHQWLIKELGKGGTSKWRSTSDLKVGHRIKHLVDPWEEDRSWEGGYLAGLYDGEGCVSGWSGRAGRSVYLTQNSGPVLDQALAMLKDKGFVPVMTTDTTRRAQQWALSGAEAMAFLGSVRPSRLMSKSKEVWEGVAPRGNERLPSYKTITSIEQLPEQELVDITTSTRTFIANGLMSHNCYDEMAHVVASGANRSAEEVYTAATPSLDQFGKDGFIMEPSSPWQMMGQFYENYQHAVALDEETGDPTYPEILMVQLASWDIYLDWERAHELPLFPEGWYGEDNGVKVEEPSDEQRYFYEVEHRTFRPLRGAIQAFDDQMARLKKANPETFAVERESKFATALDAYLNEAKVKAIFEPWWGRPERYGPPTLQMQESGLLVYSYKAHGDPSKSNANFGFALAHPEVEDDGTVHCVFDLIHHFSPSDFADNMIDYEFVEDWFWDKVIAKFYPEEFTFDQWNSASTIQKFQKKVRNSSFPKRVNVFEKTATNQYNWSRAETAKTAINMGWVHAPFYEQAELELRFLQEQNGKVEHPTIGPVQTKDVADCVFECIKVIVGEQVNNFVHGDLSNLRPGAAQMGGIDPFPQMREEFNPVEALSGFSRSRGAREMSMGMPGRSGVARRRSRY